MTAFSPAEVQAAMGKVSQIRCVSLLGERGHGKSSLARLLVQHVGLKATEAATRLRPAAEPQSSFTAASTSEEDRVTEARGTRRLEVHTLLVMTKMPEKEDPNMVPRGIGLRGAAGLILGGNRAAMSRQTRVGVAGGFPLGQLGDGAPGAQKPAQAKSATRQTIKLAAGHHGKPAVAAAAGPSGAQRIAAAISRRTIMMKAGSVKNTQKAEEEEKDDGPLAEELRKEMPDLLCYVIDSPGHAEFIAEAIAAISLADGALVVVDAAEGLLSFTEIMLRRAVAERCRLVLAISGLDKCLPGGTEPSSSMGAQQLEDLIRAAVKSVNDVASSYEDELFQERDRGVNPESGEVLFGSASQGWMLSLPRLARQICKKYGLKLDVMCKRLWDTDPGAPLKEKGKVQAITVQGEESTTQAKKRGTLLARDDDNSSLQGLKRGTLFQVSGDESEPASPVPLMPPEKPRFARPNSSRGARPSSARSARPSSGKRRIQRRSSSHSTRSRLSVGGSTVQLPLPEQLLQTVEDDPGEQSENAEGQPSRSSSPGSITEKVKQKSLLRSLVLEPLVQLAQALIRQDWNSANALLEGLGTGEVPEDDKAEPAETLLPKTLRRIAGGAAEVLIQTLFLKMPHPEQAQRSSGRMEHMLVGPPDSAAASALNSCNPEGPLMISVTRLLPSVGAGSERGNFYALGRVFSGSLTPWQRLRVDSFKPQAASISAPQICSVEAVSLPLGGMAEPLAADLTVPAGNLVLISGVSDFIIKRAALLDPEIEDEVSLVPMHMGASTQASVRISLWPSQAADLPGFLIALRHLNASDPLATCSTAEWGEHIIAASGEAHLSACLAELHLELKTSGAGLAGLPGGQSEVQLIYQKPGGQWLPKTEKLPENRPVSALSFGGLAQLGRSSPASDQESRPDALNQALIAASCCNYAVMYRETVAGASEAPCASDCLSNSPQLGFDTTAKFLGEQICADLEDGLLSLGNQSRQRSLLLAERYGWDAEEGHRIWCFGPKDGCGLNAFLDFSSSPIEPEANIGVGAWPAVEAACRWTVTEGALCEEPMRGIRFGLALRAARGRSARVKDEDSEGKQSLAWPRADTDEMATQQQTWRRRLAASARQALLAAQVSPGAWPTLQEPMVQADFVLHAADTSSLSSHVAALREVLSERRGASLGLGWDEWDSLGDLDSLQPRWAPLRLTAELPALEAIGLETLLNGLLTDMSGGKTSAKQLRVQTTFARWGTLPGRLGKDDPDSTYLQNTILAIRDWRQLDARLPESADFLGGAKLIDDDEEDF